MNVASVSGLTSMGKDCMKTQRQVISLGGRCFAGEHALSLHKPGRHCSSRSFRVQGPG